MVAVPNQQFRELDPGLGTTPEAITTYLVHGPASKGTVNAILSFNDKTAVRDTFEQGPLPELLCHMLDVAGGPIFGQRLLTDVAAVIGSVTKRPKGSSTGTVAASVTPVAPSKVWQIDDPGGTPSYVDETSDFASSTADDVDAFPDPDAVGDQLAIGFHSPFAAMSITVGSTPGTDGTVTWKYWDGSTWQDLTGVTDGTTGFTAGGANDVTWTMPTDWEPLSINGSAELYYVVAEVASDYTTVPVLSTGAITKHGPHDAYEVRAEIVTTGTLGTGEFKVSLDGGTTYAPGPNSGYTIPTGGVFDIPHTGLRLTFTPGGGATFFEAGDKFEFDVTGPFVSTTSVSAGYDKIEAGTDDFSVAVLAGRPASASAAATMFATLTTKGSSLFNAHRPIGIIMDGGIDTEANGKTEFANSEDSGIMVCWDFEKGASPKPFPGYGTPKRPFMNSVAARAAASLISTHLGRFADGALPGVTAIGYNEEKGTAAMSAARFCTARTWTPYAGFYINRPNLMSQQGSDFSLWPHRMIMDTAHRTAHRILQRFVNSKLRVLADGTGRLDPKEALRVEGEVDEGLSNNLLVPVDAEGNPGHVAAVAYRVNLEHDFGGTNRVEGGLFIVRDGYAEELITTLSFAAEAV